MLHIKQLDRWGPLCMGTLLLAAFCGTLYMYVADTMARPLDFELREDFLRDCRAFFDAGA